MLIFYYFMFCFFSGLLVFSMKRKHFLMMLLSLEFLVVFLYLMLSMNLSFMSNEYFFLMIFLTISVCEGALGLSILVSLIRSFGNDHIMNFMLLW